MTVRPAAEDDTRRDPTRERAGAVHADAQRVEVLLTQALDLFVLEDGVAHYVGAYRHRRAGLRGDDGDGCARAPGVVRASVKSSATNGRAAARRKRVSSDFIFVSSDFIGFPPSARRRWCSTRPASGPRSGM